LQAPAQIPQPRAKFAGLRRRKLGEDHRMGLEERVTEIIVEQLGVSKEEVVPEASFIDDLGADSLDIVELVMAMEEEFDIEIPDDDAEKIQTISDAISYIRGRAAAG